MKNVSYLAAAAVAVISLAACGDNTTGVNANLFNDSTTTVDIAASSGDALATSVTAMIDNEASAGGSADYAGSSASFDITRTGDWVRTKTCLDANGAVVTNCLPFSSVRKIAIQATLNATRSGTSQNNGGAAATWTGAVHRSANDTTTRNFNGTTETSRTHSGNAVAHDTTTFTDAKMTRLMSEVAHDAVNSIVFALPHSQNPWPTSGSLSRVDSVHVAITASNQTVSKDVVRTVTVTFPADAQGNVVLTVNAKTCNLNLVTHVVSACH
jgi:hypothetical protein